MIVTLPPLMQSQVSSSAAASSAVAVCSSATDPAFSSAGAFFVSAAFPAGAFCAVPSSPCCRGSGISVIFSPSGISGGSGISVIFSPSGISGISPFSLICGISVVFCPPHICLPPPLRPAMPAAILPIPMPMPLFPLAFRPSSVGYTVTSPPAILIVFASIPS